MAVDENISSILKKIILENKPESTTSEIENLGDVKRLALNDAVTTMMTSLQQQVFFFLVL